MLKVKSADKKVAKVTFKLSPTEVERQVSVVGDFNGWDPLADPLKRRKSGSQSVKVKIPLGATYRFKYLADDGSWFCDPDVDDREPNDRGEMNSVLRLP